MNKTCAVPPGPILAQGWLKRLGTAVAERAMRWMRGPSTAPAQRSTRLARGAGLAAAALLGTGLSFGAAAQTVSLTFLYNDFSGAGSQLSFNGNAGINGSQLRLTDDVGGQAGSAFNTQRVQFGTDYSFSSYFVFRMATAVSDGADGLTFTIQTSSNSSLSAGGGLGYQGIPNSLAVEFDTYENSPTDSANHVAIDINGDVSHNVYTQAQGYYVEANSVTPEFADGANYHVWVDYNGSTQTLEVRLARNSNARPGAALLSKSGINLASILGTNRAFIGFTAATGGAWESHDVLSWYFVNRHQPIDTSNPAVTYVPASTNADLSALSLSAGSLAPAFAVNTTGYAVSVPYLTTSTTVTPTVADANATVSVNDVLVASGSPSGPIALAVGNNPIFVRGIAENGSTKTYTVTVNRAAAALATLSTLPASSISNTNANTEGNVSSDGGAPVTSRGVVYATSTSPTLANSVVTSGSGTGSFIAPLSGLNPGTTYYVRAFATNDAGTAYGNEISFLTLSAPATPAAPNITGRASGTISIAWAAPNDFGSPITGYAVERSLESPISWEPAGGACAAPATATACTDNTLTPGQRYVFRVSATNSSGTSAFSPASASEIAATEPSAPAAPTATPANGRVTVSWVAPFDGGSPITQYFVSSDPPSAGCNVPGNTTTCVVNGLANGTPYTFSVHAQNIPGNGPSSPSSDPATPLVTPTTTTIAGTNTGSAAVTNETFRVDFIVTGNAPTGSVTVEARTAANAVIASCSGGLDLAGAGYCEFGPGNGNGLRASQGVAKLVAVYAGDFDNQSSNSTDFGFTVAASQTSTALVSNGPTVFGQPVQLTATLSPQNPGGGPVTGTVRFVRVVGNVTLAEVPLVNGVASHTVAATQAVGTVNYGALLLTNADYEGSNNTVNHTVAKADTTTTISAVDPAAPGDGLQVNENATVTVNVAAVAPGTGTRTGTIQVRGDNLGGQAQTTGCDIVLPATSCVLTYTAKGSSTLTATYGGDGSFNGSSGNSAQTVLGIETTLSIGALTPASPFYGNAFDVAYSVTGGDGSFNADVTLTATGPAPAMGSYTCVAAAAAGTCTFAGTLPAGDYALDASYPGDSTDLPANAMQAAFTVQKANTQVLVINTDPNPSVAGDTVDVNFSVEIIDGTGLLGGTVDISAAGITLGSCPATIPPGTSSPYVSSCSVAFNNFGPGQVVTAVYTPTDSANYGGDTHAVYEHVVDRAPTTFDSVSFNPAAPQVGDDITVEFDIDGGEGTIDGSIALSVDGAPVACGAPTFDTVSGAGSCLMPASLFQAVGTYAVQVDFVQDPGGNDASSTGNANVEVLQRETSVVLDVSPTSPRPAGTPVTFSVAVSPVGGDFFAPGNAASGSAFVCLDTASPCDAGTALCSVNLTESGAGAASGGCGFTFDDVGSRDLVAVYAGNTNFAGSTSPQVGYTTDPAPTSIAISAFAPTAIVVGEPVTVSFDVDGGTGPIDGTVTIVATLGGNTETCTGAAVNPADGLGSCVFSVPEGRGIELSGSWSFVASFVPAVGGNEDASTSAAANLTVSRASTGLVLSSSPAPSTFGGTFSLIATVTSAAPSEGYPTGDVDFFNQDSISIGVVTLSPTATPGVSQAVLSGLVRDAGTYTFRAATITNPDFFGSQDLGYEHTVQLADQTITFNQPADVDYAPGGSFVVSASSDSGLVVSFASTTTDVCTVDAPGTSPATVSIVSGGTCTLVASQGGNANYNPAPTVERSLSINRIDQTISFDDPAYRPAGAAPFALSATASSGLPVSFASETPAVCDVAGSTVSYLAPGECEITASQAGDASYNPAPDAFQSFFYVAIAIEPETLDDGVFDDAYGVGLSASGEGSQPPFTFAVTAGALPQGLSLTAGGVLSGAPEEAGSFTFTITATDSSVAGPDRIDAPYSGSRAYTLLINRAEQSISFNALPDRLQTSGDFTVAPSASSGLAVTVASETPAVCSVSGPVGADWTVTMNAPGTCTLTASQAGDADYAPATSVSQSFAVRADVVVTTGNPLPGGVFDVGYGPLQFVATGGNGDYVFSVSGGSLPPGLSLSGTGELSGTPSAAGDYSFTVRATDSSPVLGPFFGETLYDLSIARAPLDISFVAPTPASVVYSVGGSFSVATAGNNENTVGFDVSPASVCVRDGVVLNQINLIGAGICSVQAAADESANVQSGFITTEVTVQQAQPSLALASSGSPTSPGASVTFTATISGDGGPTGTVSFRNGGVDIAGCEAVALIAGEAVCVTTALPQGSNTITALYNGDANNLTALSNALTHVVLTATTTTLAPTNLSELRFGQTAVIGFSVSGGVGSNDGTVTVTATPAAGPVLSCTAPASAGTCSISGFATTGPAPAAGYTVVASYAGDADDGASNSASQTINVIRSNTNTALAFTPATSAPFGQGFTLTATVTAVAPGAGTPTGTVVFFRDGTSVAEIALNGSGVATFNVPAGQPVGSYIYRAQYGSDTNFLPSFEDRPYQVTAKATTTTVTGSTPNPSELNGLVSFAYTVTTAPGTTPAGNVTVTASTGENCTSTVASGSCSISFATAGTRSVTATYAGDSQHATSTSAAFSHTVNKAEQAALTAIATPDTIVFGATSALSTTGGSGTGPVSFAVTEGMANCSISGSTLTATGVGTCTVTATKAGDDNYLPATGTVVVTVNQAPQAALTAIATPQNIVFNGTSALSTTGGSGTGTVSFAVTANPANCSITDSTLTGTGVGTCEVTATKAADANYLAASATVTVTVGQAPQTISFGANPGPFTFGGTAGSVTATASSGLDVSFGTSSPSVCSVDASTGAITILTAGDCVVTADQAGNTNYQAAPQATQTVVINKATQSITFGANPGPFTFGGTAGSVTATASSGLDVSYGTSTGTVCSVDASTGAITILTAGDCVVTADQAGNGNYEPAPQATQTVLINRASQAALTATATPSTIVYLGTSTLATTGGSGTGAVSFAQTAGTGTCGISGSTLTGNGVGTCTVTATKAGDTNYEPATATVEVTVNRAPQATLTATATPQNLIEGGTSTLATTGGSGTGAVSFAVTGGTGTCSIVGTTLNATLTGTCVVTATKAADANYEAATASVTVTVNPASLDLAITKTGRYEQGNLIVWNLLVENLGPGSGVGSRVIDALPTTVSGASWTCVGSNGGSCSQASGSGNVDTIVDLPNGGRAVFTITATVVDPSAPTVVNTASVQPPAGITDSNMGNNNSTLDLTVALFANGFEGDAPLMMKLLAKAELQTASVAGSAIEAAARGYQPKTAARLSAAGADLLLESREIDGLVSVRLLQKGSDGLWSSTRWIELWPGDEVRIDYSSANGELKTRLAVGPQQQ
jgi:hypothetical protein